MGRRRRAGRDEAWAGGAGRAGSVAGRRPGWRGRRAGRRATGWAAAARLTRRPRREPSPRGLRPHRRRHRRPRGRRRRRGPGCSRGPCPILCEPSPSCVLEPWVAARSEPWPTPWRVGRSRVSSATTCSHWAAVWKVCRSGLRRDWATPSARLAPAAGWRRLRGAGPIRGGRRHGRRLRDRGRGSHPGRGTPRRREPRRRRAILRGVTGGTHAPRAPLRRSRGSVRSREASWPHTRAACSASGWPSA